MLSWAVEDNTLFNLARLQEGVLQLGEKRKEGKGCTREEVSV